jgi:hypothetical protein
MYQEMNKFPEKYTKGINVISLFTGITLRELKNQSVETIELLEAIVSERFVIPQKNELVMTFEYNGQLYGLENDWSKLAFGAWIDFEVYSSEDIFSNMFSTFAGSIFMGSHVVVLWIWMALRVAETVDAHSGFYFPGFGPFSLFSFQGGADRHDYHHSHNIGCYG